MEQQNKIDNEISFVGIMLRWFNDFNMDRSGHKFSIREFAGLVQLIQVTDKGTIVHLSHEIKNDGYEKIMRDIFLASKKTIVEATKQRLKDKHYLLHETYRND